MPKTARVPAMRGPNFRPPICSVHGKPARKGADGWFCPTCLNEHIHRERERKAGDARSKAGVVLPRGVKLEVPDYVRDILPNRAARRRK